MQTVASERLPKFAGHETFTLRYGWLKKAVDATRERQDIFLQDDALVTLGVGKNMVRSIRHWGLVTGILEESTDVSNNRGRAIRPSALGDLLFGPHGLDPYLEEVGTLWLIHWQLAGIPDGPTTWFWVFNHLPESEFTKEKLLSDLLALADQVGLETGRRQLPSPGYRLLPADLRLLEDEPDGRARRDPRLSPRGIGPHSGTRSQPRLRLRPRRARIASPAGLRLRAPRYWERTAAQRNALTFDEVAYRPGSPGRVFKLSEDALSRVPRRHGDLHRRGDFLRRNRRAPATLPPR